jgi:hypothetical protein
MAVLKRLKTAWRDHQLRWRVYTTLTKCRDAGRATEAIAVQEGISKDDAAVMVRDTMVLNRASNRRFGTGWAIVFSIILLWVVARGGLAHPGLMGMFAISIALGVAQAVRPSAYIRFYNSF